MKGTHRIVIQNKRIRYDFEVKRNITIIRGDSATGKTTLVDMIREYYNDGEASAVELRCDRECAVLEGRNWRANLHVMKDSIIFIDEDNEFVSSIEFAGEIQKTDNYYVIVTRESIPSLPYSVEEIYGIRNSGKYGTLKRVYNEFYHIYPQRAYEGTIKPCCIITEDSNSGFQFFRGICEADKRIACISASGKSNIFACVVNEQKKHNELLVIADGAAIGSEIEKLMSYAGTHEGVTFQ